jgi:hypothetical protein
MLLLLLVLLSLAVLLLTVRLIIFLLKRCEADPELFADILAVALPDLTNILGVTLLSGRYGMVNQKAEPRSPSDRPVTP